MTVAEASEQRQGYEMSMQVVKMPEVRVFDPVCPAEEKSRREEHIIAAGGASKDIFQPAFAEKMWKCVYVLVGGKTVHYIESGFDAARN